MQSGDLRPSQLLQGVQTIVGNTLINERLFHEVKWGRENNLVQGSSRSHKRDYAAAIIGRRSWTTRSTRLTKSLKSAESALSQQVPAQSLAPQLTISYVKCIDYDGTWTVWAPHHRGKTPRTRSATPKRNRRFGARAMKCQTRKRDLRRETDPDYSQGPWRPCRRLQVGERYLRHRHSHIHLTKIVRGLAVNQLVKWFNVGYINKNVKTK